MDIETDIYKSLEALERRINIYKFLRLVSIAMLCGIGFAIILLSVSRFVLLPISATYFVIIILLASFTIGAIKARLSQVSTTDAARLADAQLDLRERLGSAVEILQRENRSQMAELQLRDAAEYARSLDPKTVYPRIFPFTAKILPLPLAILIFLMLFPLTYGKSSEIPPEVRQTIRQTGGEIQSMAEKVDKGDLSEQVMELASEVESTGQELQDEVITKKDALRKLSNLELKAEALKTMGEMKELLKSQITPDKKRMLNELMEKMKNLRDIQGMEELAKQMQTAQQDGLSMEALEDLASALERMNMNLTSSDMAALQQMSDQILKGKRDIAHGTTKMAREPKTAGGSRPTGATAEEESGLMGSGAPGKKTADEMREQIDLSSTRNLPFDQGYESELEGQVSDSGEIISAEIKSDTEKGESVVPYEEVYVKYRDAADDAITRAKIPWTYREHVKQYFDAIKPKEDE
jgi:uncharacterized membrane protein (DUF106 family)